MDKLVKTLRGTFTIKHAKTVAVDNAAFKLHYRVTTSLLFLFAVLVTSQELIGEHIKCLADQKFPGKVLNTYCFIMSTYNLVKPPTNDYHPVHAGIGSHINRPIKHHAYYQWVSFVLCLQAIAFYIPHLLWKLNEGGRLAKLVAGLEDAAFATERPISIGTKKTPSKYFINQRFDDLKLVFKDHLLVNRSWTRWLIICEFCNLINTGLQIYFTNIFLGGRFADLGTQYFKSDDENVLSVVFPKMTKCTFHKFGAAGSIQAHDVLCVMPLNIVNEKIFMFLWFWYMFLLMVSVVAFGIRLASLVLFSRSVRLNRYLLGVARVDSWKLSIVLQHCSYEDWLFITYLARNLDALVFGAFMTSLSVDLERTNKQ